LEFRKRLSESYDSLFESGGQKDLSIEANFNAKYGWYHSVWRLAKEDVTKVDKVTATNVHYCLTALAYIKEKNDVQQTRIQNQKR
tara:strand:- start:3699 stop:3953 length:255 start_codon:yes stop_codon:yes gene_type:complete